MAHIGLFVAVKNHTFLLDVFREIVEMYDNCVLLLAGVGPTMDAMRLKAETYGIKDKVHFVGSVSNVSDLLKVADVFIFPSLYEGLGISLIEAQAAGLPCFASKGRIPDDSNITGRVKFLSLESGAKAWASEVLNVRCVSPLRDNVTPKLIASGFDISVEANALQNFYVQKYREET